jgi:hypothetical protein
MVIFMPLTTTPPYPSTCHTLQPCHPAILIVHNPTTSLYFILRFFIYLTNLSIHIISWTFHLFYYYFLIRVLILSYFPLFMGTPPNDTWQSKPIICGLMTVSRTPPLMTHGSYVDLPTGDTWTDIDVWIVTWQVTRS